MRLLQNSMKQLFRMKGKTLLFFLLLTFASGLCSLGMGFLAVNQEKMIAYEESFMTIGTVEQKADSVQERKIWDAEIQDYHIYNRPVYNTYVPVSALAFEGADYLSGPEKRCFYGSYMPQYEMYGSGMNLGIVIEGTPVEDAVPDHSIAFQVTKVLAGRGILEGNVIRFCDHNNPAPRKMYADKTYIMSVIETMGHQSEAEFEGDDVREYRPDPLLGSTQVDVQGRKLPDEVSEEHFCDEVTEGFYESPRGKRWLNLIQSWDYALHTFPVTATNDLHLIMAFYSGDAYISGGREFTLEEYESGERVCLVSELFAQKNGLAVGDQVSLSLMFANDRRTAGSIYGSHSVFLPVLLNARGENYPVFEEGDYEIVGLYGGLSGLVDEYGMGYNEIIIPSRSVKNSDADNRLEAGPMTGSTTSFRIANGAIDEYMEKWSRQGVSNVEITFYDKGYSQLAANIDNMKYIARLFLVMGGVMVLLVLVYFSWIFLVRQGDRTAIERALGFRKWQCFVSLFSGLFLLIFLGSVCGCSAGSYLSERIARGIANESYYDTTFGNSAAVEAEEIMEQEFAGQVSPMRTAACSALLIMTAGTMISGVGIWRNLRREPMQMFGEK